MRSLFLFLAILIASISHGQSNNPYPYNPDVEPDGWIGVGDILQLLATFGQQFSPGTWQTDSLNAAAVLDGTFNYFECKNSCHQLAGHWRMVNIDAFGRHYDLAASINSYFWVDRDLSSEQFVWQINGQYPDLANVPNSDMSSQKKCMCYLRASPFVPDILSYDTTPLQYEIDSIQNQLLTISSNLDSLETVITSAPIIEPDPLPLGTILPIASNSIPQGWLICDGREIPISEYPELYSKIGTTFGSGDSAYWAQVDLPGTTFNIPDLRGRTITGVDDMGILGAANVLSSHASELGSTGGAEMHTLTQNELPNIVIDLGGITIDPGGGCSGACSPPYLIQQGDGYWTMQEGASQASNGGGDQAHPNMQPYLAMLFMVKATVSTEN